MRVTNTKEFREHLTRGRMLVWRDEMASRKLLNTLLTEATQELRNQGITCSAANRPHFFLLQWTATKQNL